MAQLKIGELAPDFQAATVYDGSLQLSAVKGQRLLLAFHRYASCPVCNFSLRQFEARHAEFNSRGLAYVPVFHSTAEKLKEYYPQRPPFPIVSDPEMKLYKLYGLTPSIRAFLHPKALRDGLKAVSSIGKGFKFGFSPDGGFTTRPADFLIGPDGKIEALHYGESLGDAWSPDEVLVLLKA